MNRTLIATIGVVALAIPAAAMADSGADNVQFVSDPVVQQLPATDTAPLPAKLPICKSDQQSACINRYAATGKGTRPLGYWPGEPASAMPHNADH
ncbi:hypothetical protein [Tsuneonella mangrovi]|uniref:hypothetical protein n=1 Tax=Tsuneonella mangrovi TaxID=1982042 RepID=UPI0012374AD3|nr:hypothetical protein [Tsuneonella mangrovi]